MVNTYDVNGAKIHGFRGPDLVLNSGFWFTCCEALAESFYILKTQFLQREQTYPPNRLIDQYYSVTGDVLGIYQVLNKWSYLPFIVLGHSSGIERHVDSGDYSLVGEAKQQYVLS